MKHTINIVDPSDRIPPDSLCRFAEDILVLLEAEASELTIAFVNEAEMHKLNYAYRRKDYATDVLSFPMGERQPHGDIYLGDIAISQEVAERQAHDIGHSLVTEIFHLTAHGVLHLLGFDHETDNGEMVELEKRIALEVMPRYC